MSDLQPPTSENNDPALAGQPALSEADAAAIDALVAAGLDPARVSEPMRSAAERVARTLGLLATSERFADVDVMVDAVMARVRLQEQRSAPRDFALSGNDEDALESLVAAEYRPQGVPSVLRRRATRQADLLALLEPSRADIGGADPLIARTLARVQTSIDSDERSRVLSTTADVSIAGEHLAGRRFRLGDLVTVAAMLLIGTAAVWPMVGAFREQSRRIACQSNLQAAGLGFGSYAAEHRDSLPMAVAGRPGTPWWFVGKPEQSNSANLFTLARTGYTRIDQLACPGNPEACRVDPGPGALDWRTLGEVSYSYQNLFGIGQPRLHATSRTGHLVLAVDGSPVVRRAIRGQWINPLANSMNHQGKGQNALFNDGRVEWLTTPVLAGGEHIWLPHAIERGIALQRHPTQAEPIKGIETPAGSDDVFVGP